MNANVIDTERYATRLKDAGVEDRVASATARALNDELLASNLVTKQDLNAAVTGLRTEMLGKFEVLNTKLDTTSRYTFLILALVVGLGLFNALEPRLSASETPVATEPANAAPENPVAELQASPATPPSTNIPTAPPP